MKVMISGWMKGKKEMAGVIRNGRITPINELLGAVLIKRPAPKMGRDPNFGVWQESEYDSSCGLWAADVEEDESCFLYYSWVVRGHGLVRHQVLFLSACELAETDSPSIAGRGVFHNEFFPSRGGRNSFQVIRHLWEENKKGA